MAVSGCSVVLGAVRYVQRVADILLIAAIIAPLILFGVQFPHSPKLDELGVIILLHRYGDPAVASFGNLFGITWPSTSTKSLLPLGVSFVVWLVKIAVDAVLLAGHKQLSRLMPAPQLAAAIEAAAGLPGETGAMKADSEGAREELLRRYREIENALKTAKRKRCTFLAIDVAGSTQMKKGERETEILATFHAYAEMLKGIFEQYGAWKVAWTPDGVMVCFLQLDLGLGAAQRVLQSLKQFNETENRLRTPFRVRCGLNVGEVQIFEDSKLEKVADHVIDVAGHMQKQSAPNAVWMSREVYEQVVEKAGFRPTGQSVDGHEALEWSAEPTPEPADKTEG